ncbi:hypothetical protein CEE36_11075 [candidate division TA06 bacterium B3_TA06]|uniref:pEK499-p136 HEPN domain-containing protein n=1 Tax=candidate division TA06 bacterium B3_TA06 TaxID=2012487 RepID=A0A532URS1_UNCT6|nr:MAG: hypothetical protein CEE36_11075 [candidate division TA06 bacterium B3_TA06]
MNQIVPEEESSLNLEDQNIMVQSAVTPSFLDDFVMALKKDSSQKIGDFYHQWLRERIHDESYELFNQGVVLSCCYGTLVYPYNKIKSNLPNLSIDELTRRNWGKWRIDLHPPKHVEDLKTLVWHLRNSLSHSLVSTQSDTGLIIKFVFEDRPDENSDVNFRFIIGVNDLRQFIFKFGMGCLTGEWD